MKTGVHIRRWLTAAVLALGISALAHAGLVSPVTVSLLAPGGIAGVSATPINATQIAPVPTGFNWNDAGDISGGGSGFMLDGERIFFVDNSIRLRVAAGFDDGAGNFSTGYLGSVGNNARYEFSNLSITGFDIIGASLFAIDGYGDIGFSGLISGGGVALIGGDTVTFRLDDLLFKDRNLSTGFNFAEFRIDLQTRAITGPPVNPPNGVPEPSTLACLAAAGLAFWATRRRSKRATH